MCTEIDGFNVQELYIIQLGKYRKSLNNMIVNAYNFNSIP